jgi:hypothetical protein
MPSATLVVAALLVIASPWPTSGVQTRVVPDVEACVAITVVYPRDGWRLTIPRNGAARINYAALPQTAEAPANALRLGDVFTDLGSRLRVSCQGDRFGAIEFRTALNEERPAWRCTTDEAFVEALFEQAWRSVPEPTDAVERDHVDLLRSMWRRRTAPRAKG